ncbi:hypothetical protein [Chryseobacterium sp. GP-SGM7]|uniref:hypothetical protein n=1 Tax=Chryseobacterium sp. GP-SGM7 TaxID=3411323 RepID=UPI003B94261C
MRKIVLFLAFSVMINAQKVEIINLNQNIRDKKGLVKSLTFIDKRDDKTIGNVTDKESKAEIKFTDDNLKNYVEKWFQSHNNKVGNNDVVIMLENLKVYDEVDENKTLPYAKARIKISGFLKRNDRYYFITRFDNVIVCNPKTVSHPQKYLAQQISDVISEFIKLTYSGAVSSSYIPENEINNYDSYLIHNNKAITNSELKDGVYTSFRNFYNQQPSADYHLEKNKKGKVVRLIKNDLSTSFSEMYCYVENGVAYKLTPVGFDEMKKNKNGFYIFSSRVNLFSESKTGGIMIGAIAGGVVGALIGAAIDSGSNGSNGAVNGVGFKSTQQSNIYIDSLTGAYIFEK